MSSEESRAYVLIEIKPGKEKQFTEYVMSKDLVKDINVERMDFVHGSFDVVVLLRGTMKSIDARIMELRKSPLIRRTETLLAFGQVYNWEDISGRLNE
jgi:hypothetical protein